MFINMGSPALTRRPAPALHSGRRGLGLIGELVAAWMERRRSRRHLAQLDERLLRDIGLTPGEAMEEAAAPFWKP